MLAFLLLASIFGPQSCVCTSHVNEIRATTWSTARQTELAAERTHAYAHLPHRRISRVFARVRIMRKKLVAKTRGSRNYTCLCEDAGALNLRLFCARSRDLTIIGPTSSPLKLEEFRRNLYGTLVTRTSSATIEILRATIDDNPR